MMGNYDGKNCPIGSLVQSVCFGPVIILRKVCNDCYDVFVIKEQTYFKNFWFGYRTKTLFKAKKRK